MRVYLQPHMVKPMKAEPNPWSLCSEALYEDDSFPERELAALVAAKVYYNLQEYDESMLFALGAGKLFNLDRVGEFEETIICTTGSLAL